ncbi:PREDICTED: tripartite motif-containing protein 45-like isoform X2 [Vollenhovia emeryi]|uniref:tripartite motif-containing protein 45-like isoform X2 n=1 Tax=Vollenhovia emeryi TaxID=411798 RepID=UPI0005F42687|nr:PREDICTED: tripartite motif-containing protein 45-like isoform X2 [Vollenhovia emeryi]
MDFVNCSTKRSAKGCCGREAATGSELGSCDHIYANLVECKSKGVNTENFVHVEPMTIACTNKREDSRKRRAACSNSHVFAYQSSPAFVRNKLGSEVEEEPMRFFNRSPHDADFQCPRCGQRMEEPRLLPCLHPICSPCVYELMSKPPNVSSRNEVRDNGRMYAQSDVHETCPLCDSRLPNANSAVPPPHYPLQHRSVMDTVRRKLVNRVLCDTCTGEVPALVQCSTCLRNFCSECGRQHERQNLAEARTVKHLMRPLWEATKVRRTTLCQTHPTHALRFYCIACQQVTCKECMWSAQHRGHASEDAVGVGKRAGTYLAMMLQKARSYLNNLLVQYNHDVFSNNDLEEAYNIAKICRYVQLCVCVCGGFIKLELYKLHCANASSYKTRYTTFKNL